MYIFALLCVQFQKETYSVEKEIVGSLVHYKGKGSRESYGRFGESKNTQSF